ncbi:MAG TPA: ATP-binding protein [Vicinamibacterales bacterium]|nr:ATP-binding protein [Vicinamibacterales bacterium]
MIPDSVLVIDADPVVLELLLKEGSRRGLDFVGAQSIEEVDKVLGTRPFGVAVVNLRLGAMSGLDVIKRVRDKDPSTEAIVISADRRLSSALDSYAHNVFAFVPKPFDPAHLYATVVRALERRRDAMERQRLTWELRLLNQVAATVAVTTDIGDALQHGLQRVAEAYSAEWAVLRLTPLDGGPLVVRAVVGGTIEAAQAFYEKADGDWPSAESTAGGPPVRSTVSVPVVGGQDVLGVLTVNSTIPNRFSVDDGRVLRTIGRQLGVAVANGQLYERVYRAKVQWERTFDAISDPIAVFDGRARTMRTNAALATLRGWAIRETRGRTCADVGLCGGGCPDCLVGRAIRDGQRIDQEVTTGDGRIFAVTTMPVPDSSGTAVLFAKEMTEERQRARQLRTLSQELAATNAELVATLARLRSTQAQLVQAEKLSAIGQLVAGVAHELNNPLTSVIGFAQLVHEDLSATPDLAATSGGLMDDVSRILSEAERAARIVRNLLTFSRRQTADRAEHDVADLCARVAALRSYDSRVKGIEIVTNFAPDLPSVFVDFGEFQQALLNLVLNAEQAMRTVEVKRLELTAHAEPECGAVVIRVSDSGHGIEPENLARVFDPFFTTRGVGEGTGLGLSIVYGIVRDHGGQIWVESEVGVGTTFSIRLPVRSPAVEGQPRPVVLVAHGDAVSRDFFSAALGGWGLGVRLARNAREAFESLSAEDLNAALIDHAMVGADPQHWREAWAPVRGRIRMVAVTTGEGTGDAMRFLRDAADATLSPPYDLPALRRALVITLGDAL